MYLVTYVALSDPGSMHVQVSLPSIGGQPYIEMSFWQFCINPVTLGPYGKLSVLYINVPLSLNRGEKLLNGIEIFSHTGQHFNGVFDLQQTAKSMFAKLWYNIYIIYIYGQESLGWISLYKLVTFSSFFENIQKPQFFFLNWLVNEFRTAMGGGLIAI